MSKLSVNLDLIKKYNVPGPRYTSYPPATQFTDQLSLAALEENVRVNARTERPLSLYYHLPFCESLCWFCGCTTVITTDHAVSQPYVDHLLREMDLVKSFINPKREVVQLHFGGGTPTFLAPSEIRRLGEGIRTRFPFAKDLEAGVEVDPRRLTRDHVVALREAGFNRASMGVQDNQADVQKAIHRIQPFAMTQQTTDWLREEGFQSLNIDLIYGLPHQTVATFERTLDEILTLNPDRFAVFSYAHVPWIKPAQKILEEKILPSPETKLQLLKLTIEKLTAEGYVYIGMDHFARATDELAVAQREKTLQRNFQGYSTRGQADIYAFGMSAISQTEDAYWQNLKELPAYYAAVEAGKMPMTRGYLMTAEDKLRRSTIMRLMCDLGLDYAAMSRQLGVNFAEHFGAELASLDALVGEGLIEKNSSGLTVTDLGRLHIRNIAMAFDAYLPEQGERRFSRTI